MTGVQTCALPIYECNVDTIAIDKEIQYIRNYVALQRTRKEEDLQVALDIPENIRGFAIAPLIFTTFIENAFKYVSNHEDGDNRVEIAFLKKGGVLEFRSFNTKDRERMGYGAASGGRGSVDRSDQNAGGRGSDPGMSAGRPGHGGIGLANIRRRLELQYPGKYQLLIRNEAGSYEITLNLQIDDACALKPL